MYCRCGTRIENVRKGFKSDGCPQKPHKICLDCGITNARDNKYCRNMSFEVFGFGRYEPLPNPVDSGCGSKNLVPIGSKEHKNFLKMLKSQKKVSV